MIKKTLIAIIAIFTILLNITTADAKVEYYQPLHVTKFVEERGYSFEIPGYEYRHENFENDYIMVGKTILWESPIGVLRGLAHAYDNITKASDSNAFRKVFNKDFDKLAFYLYENNCHFADPKEAYIESFMMYCEDEAGFKKACPNIYNYLTNAVMKCYEDVERNSWYRDYVEDAYYLGLMTGATDTLFKPDAKMNRAMVATVLHRMEGSPKTTYKKYFSDVDKNQYYSTAVTWCKKNGVISGYTDGTFKPTKNVTREEMVTMIYNYANYKDSSSVKSIKDIAKFKDANKVSPYAKKPIMWGYKWGIISGKDNGTRLDPKGTATRAECAKMLVQAYKVI